MSFLQTIDRIPAFHHAVRMLRLRELAGAVLGRFPRVRKLPDSAATYRCRYLETILLADEIFHRNVYLKAIPSDTVQTFADLGSNVGLFAVLLKHLTRRQDLQGIMVDANPPMVEETRWHLEANGLSQVTALFGLVGTGTQSEAAEFYVHPSNLGSSQFPVHEPGKPTKGDWRKVIVPSLSLENEWKQRMGDARCHILKVDIEGSEDQLFKHEVAFLARVDTLIVEWHKWIVSLEEITAQLASLGFERVEVLEDLEATGIAWFRTRRA
jgi:FkbM family methyltransferase